MPVDGQPFLFFPTPSGPQILLQIHADFFPRFKPPFVVHAASRVPRVEEE
jgi:hypothetical protein